MIHHLMSALVVVLDHDHYLESVNGYWIDYDQIAGIGQRILQNGGNHHRSNCNGYCYFHMGHLSKSSKIIFRTFQNSNSENYG